MENKQQPAQTNARSPHGGRPNDRRRPNDRNRRREPEAPKQFEEVVINVDRVSRVVKGGRRFRFKALVAVGDRKNRVGVGVAKGGDVQVAVQKATDVAKKNLITIPIYKDTIPHDVETRVCGAHVLLKPAAPGTGVIAGGVVRSIISLTSVKNLISKSLGSSNKVNLAYATIEGLKELKPRNQWVKRLDAKKTITKPVVAVDAKPVVKPVAKKTAVKAEKLVVTKAAAKPVAKKTAVKVAKPATVKTAAKPVAKKATSKVAKPAAKKTTAKAKKEKI